MDITVLSLCQAKENNAFFRLDSDYQAKDYLEAAATVRNRGAQKLSEGWPAILHPREIERHYVDDNGIWFLRAQNLRPLWINDSERVLVSYADAQQLASNRVRVGDILMTRTGANRGDCALFDLNDEAIASSHTFIIRCPYWEHEYLVAFFNCRYGELQIDRGVYGAAQPEIAPYYLGHIWIPEVSRAFQHLIAGLFRQAAAHRARARHLMQAAEQHLGTALGLVNWRPPEPLAYERNAKEAFAAGRIDAEYFHPAKQAYLERLSSLPGNSLAAHYWAVREVLDPKTGDSNLRVRNYDLTDALQPVLDERQNTVTVSELGSLKKRLAEGDVVISRLRSYLREIAIVRTYGGIPAVGSSEFIVLRPQQAQPALSQAALLVFLRSHPVQTILKWSQDGSNHPRFADEVLLSLPVPNAVINAAPAIETLFKTMIAARRYAESSLSQAKRAVEIAIEQSESAALSYLDLSAPEITTIDQATQHQSGAR